MRTNALKQQLKSFCLRTIAIIGANRHGILGNLQSSVNIIDCPRLARQRLDNARSMDLNFEFELIDYRLISWISEKFINEFIHLWIPATRTNSTLPWCPRLRYVKAAWHDCLPVIEWHPSIDWTTKAHLRFPGCVLPSRRTTWLSEKRNIWDPTATKWINWSSDSPQPSRAYWYFLSFFRWFFLLFVSLRWHGVRFIFYLYDFLHMLVYPIVFYF